MEAASASGDPLAVIPLLPRAFEFVFAQMEEIKRDSANAHIRLIAPYLARHGAAYERAKFEVRACICWSGLLASKEDTETDKREGRGQERGGKGHAHFR